ncbi:MAG TPA: sugar ABC transporter permease [Bacillota bacterium]|nr:sugar ABC transporter permease [Bacillota bacterium]
MKLKIRGSQPIGYLFVLPALLFMLAFIGYPIVYNIILSVQDVTVMTFSNPVKKFVGVGNYLSMFKDPLLKLTLFNTLFYTIACIALQFTIGFALALLFNKKFQLAKSIRGLIMVAWLIPMTVTGLLFKFIFSTNGGIINAFLVGTHTIKQPIEWLLQPGSAMWTLIITNTWIGIPFNMILLVTGLSTIPNDIYESAAIDGANWWRQFYHITFPLIKPAIEAVLILGFIYTFKVFDLVYVMTKGGPVNATEVLSTLSYRLSFNEFSFSKGAAVANILFVILFIMSLGYLKLVKDEEAM